MPPGENAVRNHTKIPHLWQAFFLDFTRFSACGNKRGAWGAPTRRIHEMLQG
jgi:hypothetical protein